MKEIPLTKGLIAIVDDSDYENLAQFKWYAVGHPGKEYAARYGRKPQHIRLHRELLNAPKNMRSTILMATGSIIAEQICDWRLGLRTAETERNSTTPPIRNTKG